jgi:hypothetical protein
VIYNPNTQGCTVFTCAAYPTQGFWGAVQISGAGGAPTVPVQCPAAGSGSAYEVDVMFKGVTVSVVITNGESLSSVVVAGSATGSALPLRSATGYMGPLVNGVGGRKEVGGLGLVLVIVVVIGILF